MRMSYLLREKKLFWQGVWQFSHVLYFSPLFSIELDLFRLKKESGIFRQSLLVIILWKLSLLMNKSFR